MAHSHAIVPPGPRGAAIRRLKLVLGLTAAYALAEVIGGLASNSLALLADAGHMLTDIFALALALVAAWTAQRPPDPTRTYGYQRVEILAALFNGVALIVIALFITLEAWERLRQPQEVASGLMALVATGGLLLNVFAAWVLRRHQHGLNMRAAYLHVLGDLLGSIGALVAAGLIAFFGWVWADPVTSVVIAAIIVFSAVRLLLESLNVLMEGTPAHLRAEEVQDCLLGLPGVSSVHDLHLWSLGGHHPILTAHLVHDHSLSQAKILRLATETLRERFQIVHATLQIEPPDFNIVDHLTPVGEVGSATDRDR